jgi:hypothetical protein
MKTLTPVKLRLKKLLADVIVEKKFARIAFSYCGELFRRYN